MQAKQRVIVWTFRVAYFSDTPSDMGKPGEVGFCEDGLFGSESEDNFGRAMERSGIVRNASAGELQAMTTKRNFGRRQSGYFHLAHQFLDLSDRFGKALPNGRFICRTHKPGFDIPAVRRVDFSNFVPSFFHFI